MKNIRLMSSLVALVLLSLSSVALADRPRSHLRVGVYVGGPYLYWHPAPIYYYYPPPYYAVEPAAPAEPPVYIEQDMSRPAAATPYYWYYCEKPQGYYPYIKECPGGWRAVEPTQPKP